LHPPPPGKTPNTSLHRPFMSPSFCVWLWLATCASMFALRLGASNMSIVVL
jgi:hypothetical protein